MAALVGTVGTAVQSTSGNAASPAFGASENRTNGNLIVLWVTVTGTATLPTTPVGFSIAKQVAGTSTSATIYYKNATGSDAAPSISGIASGLIAAQLGEFSGALAVVDQTGSSTGTTSPNTATAGGANAATGELITMAAADFRSVARASNDTWTSNDGSPTLAGSNNGTSSANHYSHAYIASSTATTAQTSVVTLSITTSITGIANVNASFKTGIGTFQQWAQAQAKIFKPPTAQAQADIKATTNVFAQSQTDIEATGNVFAQSNADILAIGRGFAQATADILVTSNKFAQANTRVTAFVTSGSVSGTTTQTITLNGLQENDIVVGWVYYPNTISLPGTSFSNVGTNTVFDMVGTTHTLSRYMPNSRGLLSGFNSSVFSIVITGTGTFIAHAVAFRAGVGLIYLVDNSAHNFTTGTNPSIGSPTIGAGQIPQDLVVGAVGELTATNATVGSNFLGITATNDGSTESLTSEYYDFATSSIAVNFTNANSVEWEGIADSFIKARVTFQSAQAQADILKTTNAFAQSNADILATGRGFAQAQADMKATSNGFAQSQSDIKAISNGFAQAQVCVVAWQSAQAQADIKVITTVFAQAQAQVQKIGQGFSQAQTRIGQTTYERILRGISGLQSYWTLGESSGSTTISDYVGAISGTVNGTPTFSQAPDNNQQLEPGIKFNSISDFLAFGDNYDLTGTPTFTILAWFKTSAVVSQGIITKRDSGSLGWGLRLSSQVIFTRNGTSSLISNSYATNQWNFVAANTTGNSAYNDVITSPIGPTSITDTTADLKIGGESFSGTFQGSIGSVAIFNTSVSFDDLQALYTIEKSGAIVRPAQAQAKIAKSAGYAQATTLVNGTYFLPFLDTFTRTVSDSLGTSDNGDTWTLLSGTAANADVNGSSGTLVSTVSREIWGLKSTLASSSSGYEFSGKVSINAIPAAQSILLYFIISAGGLSTVNQTGNLGAVLSITPINITLGLNIHGSSSNIPSISYSVNDTYNFVVQLIFTSNISISRKAKLWKVGNVEPGWSALSDVSIASFPVGFGYPILYSDLNSDANSPFTWTFDDFKIIVAWQTQSAQAQADIKVTSTGFAQAQTKISTTNQFAQAQADIDTVTNGFAQAQAQLILKQSGFSQAATLVNGTYFLPFLDTFTRTVTDSLGTSDNGDTWVIKPLGTAANTDVNGSQVTFVTSASSLVGWSLPHTLAVAPPAGGLELSGSVSIDKLYVAQSDTFRIGLRSIGTSFVTTSLGSISLDPINLSLGYGVDGSFNINHSAVAYSAGDTYNFKIQLLQSSNGRFVGRTKLWKIGDLEPGWDEGPPVGGTLPLAPQSIRIASLNLDTDANAPHTWTFDNLQIIQAWQTQSAQAQAQIVTVTPRFAQAQTKISTTRVYAQGQGTIILMQSTYPIADESNTGWVGVVT